MGIPAWFREENEQNLVSASHEMRQRVLETIVAIDEKLKHDGNETDIQNLLKTVPEILGGGYRLGHGTYAFSETALPPEYRLDWLVASGNSAGLDWDLIELEDPQKLPFLSDGHYSESARKGINQIKDWRNYIQNNLDYVTKSKSSHGLGFHDLRPRSWGMVVVGRSATYNSHPAKNRYDENRKRTKEDDLIEIVSYESFLQRCRFEYLKPPLG